MAVSAQQTVHDRPWFIRKVHMSSMASGTAENVTHGGPSGMLADDVTYSVTKRCSTPCAFTMTHVAASDSAANGTANIVFDAETGGSLTGMEADVFFHFYSQTSGGLT